MIEYTNGEFKLELSAGSHSIEFYKEDNAKIKGSVSLLVSEETEATYKISCFSDKITVETISIESCKPLGENEIKIDNPASYYKDKKYQDVKSELKELGFTNIKEEPVYDIIFGLLASEGGVKSISIRGDSDFKKGAVFNKDDEIVIVYHLKVEDDPQNTSSEQTDKETTPVETTDSGSGTLYYTTNDKETAKNGNSGVYAYSKQSGEYKIYYVIDFDGKIVYRFTDSETSYSKATMVSGTLNDVLIIRIIRYHAGSDTWDEGLCFRFKNQPNTLIVQDGTYEYKFETADLKKAKELLDKRMS